ncbi:proteasome component M29 [Coemansia sp. RSA 1843]|nr:proteasome component M29 [Coemansia sp. RSA 1843]
MTDSADLELIESIQLRFALANSDEQMQKLVSLLLVPLLDKLDIASATVRTKIIVLLGQINKKLKGRPEITLPFDALVKSTFEKDTLGFSQSFRLMYITMAVSKADTQSLVAAIPQFLEGIRGRSKAQQVPLATALLTAVMKCDELSDNQLKGFGFVDSPHAAETLLACAKDLFLVNPIQQIQAPGAMQIAVGLNADSQALVTNNGKALWVTDKDALQTLKLSMARIVGSGQAFPTEVSDQLHQRRFMALLCASADPYFQRVAGFGKDSLKRMRPIDYESRLFVDMANTMFLGTVVAAESTESPRSPVAPTIRLKLLSYLSKSTLAVAVYPQWTKIISEGLFSASSTAKLRQHAMIFLQWAISQAPEEQILQAAPMLMQNIHQILSEAATGGSLSLMNADTIRGAAYVAWGTLVRRAPALVLDDLEHVQSIFEAFETESATVRLSIQEALVAMLPAYKSQRISISLQSQLLGLLQKQLTSPIHQARYVALRYAISVFPFTNMDARWLCILGLADSKSEIQLLARSGLTIQPSFVLDDSEYLPDLAEAICFIYRKNTEMYAADQTRTVQGTQPPAKTNPRVACGMLDFGRSLLLAAGMNILRTQDKHSSAVDLAELDSVNSNSELSSESQRKSMRFALEKLSATVMASGSLEAMWMETVSSCISTGSSADTAVLSKSLMYTVELMSFGSGNAALSLLDKRDTLFSLLDIRNLAVQIFAAQALSVIFEAKLFSDCQSGSAVDSGFWSTCLVPRVNELLKEIEAPERPKQLNRKLGSILALGHISHGLTIAQKALSKQWAELGIQEVEAILGRVRLALIDGIRASSKVQTQSLVTSALCSAIGEVGKTTPMIEVIPVLKDMAKQSENAKVQEAAVSSLSSIAFGDPEQAPSITEFFVGLSGTVTKKQLDIHFRIGEALAVMLGRFKCTLTEMGWIFPINPMVVYREQGTVANTAGVDKLLEAITTKMTNSINSQERQAAAIWIMSLARFCPGIPQLMPWLSKLHTCLSRLLSDRNELTQEVSSQTLGLLYEMGDTSLREDMMYSLIAMFGTRNIGKNRQQQQQQQQQQQRQQRESSSSNNSNTSAQQLLRNQIASDEPLLEQESLGQTPDGHTVNTTYKSILSLASDMQNPSLVYQFMQLATHTAMWNSRCGAAYGFARIIERAREAIQPYMKTIVPKLYRYTFDPSPQTQTAMKSIWHALLGPRAADNSAQADKPDSTPTLPQQSGAGIVEQYWDSIMEECLTSMGQREWKVRESGCNALSGAIGGAGSELAVPYLERIWQMSFRTLDDIKGSVREAGLKMCQSLANATVAWCTPHEDAKPSQEKQAQAVLKIVVPYLVDTGAVSDAEDVRNFSIGLLLKLCKSSGRYLSPSVPIIVERLLESLSNMESQSANYLSFHTGAQGISHEDLESARLSAVKASPIMRGIEMVLEQLTPSSMAELVPKLQDIIRHGLGLPTRAGCARTVVILCVKKTELVKPFASALVKAISGSLTENSALQRQAWAAAIGYMAPKLTPAMFRNLLKHLEKVYFEKHEDEMRGVSGQVIEQLAQRCPERLCENTSGPGTTSFVLFGCWDSHEPISKAFSSAWQEYKLGVGSGLVGDEESLMELLRLPLKRLSDDSWAGRIQSAKAIVEVAQMVERTARTIESANSASTKATRLLESLTQATLPELIRASQGRLWPGKEHVLAALVKVCTSCATLINRQMPVMDSDDQDALQQLLIAVPQTVSTILLKEMTTGEVSYRREATARFNSFVEAVPMEIYDKASGVLADIARTGMVTGEKPTNAMDVDDDDSDDRSMKRPQQLLLVAIAIKALQNILPKSRLISVNEADALSQVLCGVAETGVWNTRVASLECLAALFKHCSAVGASNVSADQASIQDLLDGINVGAILDAIRTCATEGKYVSVRTAALNAVEAAFGSISAVSGSGAGESSRIDIWKKDACAIAEMLAKDPVPSYMRKKMNDIQQTQTERKYAAHPVAVAEMERLVTWSEIIGGLVVLALLLTGLAFVMSAFLLATISVGQLELRAVLLFQSWWVSGPLIAAAAVLVLRRRLWLRIKPRGTPQARFF